jgi:hypothetical protein
MRALRLSLVGTAIVMLLGSMSAVSLAQDEASPVPTATPAPVGEVCDPVDLPYDPEDIHLSGVWSSDDGAVYYIGQVGSRIYLNGMSGRALLAEDLGRQWTLVATGTLADDGTMTLDYGMVPRGSDPPEVGTATGRFTGQPGEATRLSLTYLTSGYSSTLTPCAAPTRSTTTFRPGFSIRDDARAGLTLFDNGSLVWLPATDHAGVENGIAVWQLVPSAARTCDQPYSGPTLDPGAEAFLAWLQSREDLTVSEPVDVTVDGRPATMVDLTPVPGATGCNEDGTKLRLWSVYGADSAVFTDSMARVILMDVGDTTVAIEMYGDDQEAWLPLAQKVVDTIQFTG